MVKEKVSFKEFQSAVAPEHQAFVDKLNNKLIELGYNLVIKEAKSGYTCFIPAGEKDCDELGVFANQAF